MAEDLMKVSATNEGGNEGNSNERLGMDRAKQAGTTIRTTGNKMKNAVNNVANAAKMIFGMTGKHIVKGIVIAAVVFLILVVISAGYFYLKLKHTIDFDDTTHEYMTSKLDKTDYLFGYKGQNSDFESFEDIVEFYMSGSNEVFSRVATTDRAGRVSSLDNFLFIGDSRYAGMDSQLKALGTNIKNVGVGSSNIGEWIKVVQQNGKGTVQTTDVDITGTYSGISIQLGANSIGYGVDKTVSEMKTLIEELQKLHPNTPIFVNSCIQVHPKANSNGYSWNPETFKNNLNTFNERIKTYCESANNVYYIDISTGLNDSEGYLKEEYTHDGLHCNSSGVQVVATNIKNGILNANATGGEVITVDSILADMTLEEKIYQLLMVQQVVSNGSNLADKKYGGVIVATNSTYTANLGDIGSNYKIAPFISTDDEGGTVTRAATQYTTKAREYGDSQNYTQLSTDELEKSNYLLGLGINLNLGPVTDVIGAGALYNRSFSGNHDVVKECIKTIIEARKKSKVNGISISSSLKHYPGYPDVETNSDHGIATSDRSMEDINKNIEVFKSGIAAGAQSIMVSNVIYTNYDSANPASLSSKIIGDLRSNFDGVIMTDDIGQAKGVENKPNRYKDAIIAGNDMILIWDGQVTDAYNQINSAVSEGTITEERINESVKRILDWKAEVGLLEIGTSTENNSENNSNTQSGGIKTETIKIQYNEKAEEYCIATNLTEIVENIYKDTKESGNLMIKRFKNERRAKESIRLWLVANYSTQYVNLSKDVTEDTEYDYDEDYIQGIIKVKRYQIEDNGEETSKYITYKTPEEFQTLKSNYESSGDKEVFNYFTIDTEDNLVVAIYTKETQTSSWTDQEDPKGTLDEQYTKYTIREQKLSYRNMIVQYTMPYYLFCALTMYGNDAEFTNEVAELMMNSEMTIGIRDNVTTTVTTTVDNYLREEKIRKFVRMNHAYGDYSENTSGTFYYYSIMPSATSHNSRDVEEDFEANDTNTKLLNISETPAYEKTTINTLISNSATMNIEYIDGWCFNHNIEYESKITNTQTGGDPVEQTNTEYEITKEYTEGKITNLTDKNQIRALQSSHECLRTIDGEGFEKIRAAKENEILRDKASEVAFPNNDDVSKVMRYYVEVGALQNAIVNKQHMNFTLQKEFLASRGITVDDEGAERLTGSVAAKWNSIVDAMGTEEYRYKTIYNAISINLIDFGTENKERQVNRTVTTTVDVESRQYNKIKTTTEEKVDRKPEKGEENFVSILTQSKYKKVLASLTGSSSSYFFTSLEKNENTACLVDLIKYLFYKATNKDFGVTEYEFDFTVKSSTGMNKVQGTYGDDILTKFTMAWEGTVTDENGNYVIHRASTDPTIGYGIYLYYNLDNFQKAGFFQGVTLEQWQNELYQQRKNQQGQQLCDIDGTVLTNQDIDKVKKYVMETHKTAVQNYLNSNNITGLEDYQIHALVQVNYQRGNINGLKNYYPNNMEGFFLSYWQDGQIDRREACLELWNTGVYRDKAGNEIVGATGAEGEYIQSESGGYDGITGYFTSGGKTYTMFQQGAGPWATSYYYFNGTTTIKNAACGMVSTLIIASGWGCELDPVGFRDAYTGPNGGWSGAIDPMRNCLVNNFGANPNIYWASGANKDDIAQHLQTGNPTIVLVHKYYLGDHYYGGHYFTLLGINETGTEVFVSDPGNCGYSGWYPIDEVIKPGLDNYLNVY